MGRWKKYAQTACSSIVACCIGCSHPPESEEGTAADTPGAEPPSTSAPPADAGAAPSGDAASAGPQYRIRPGNVELVYGITDDGYAIYRVRDERQEAYVEALSVSGGEPIRVASRSSRSAST